MKEPHAQMRFEPRDILADGGGRQAEAPRRRRKAARFGGLYERFNEVQRFHVISVVMLPYL
jgi:hypothetical protein